MPPPPPSKPIRMRDVPRYIRTKHFFDVTRMTAYNWTTIGVKGVKLRTVQKGCFRTTRKEWIDAFVDHLSGSRVL